MVRIIEHNDWVIITLLACLFALSLMFIFLLRDIRIKDFFVQEYADSSNSFLAWCIVSIVFCILLSVLLSQYIPIVPKQVTNLSVLGSELNKVGFTFGCISLFYLGKTFMTFIFYSGIGNARKWGRFYFTATRFYFALSLLLIILCFTHYYFPIDKRKTLSIYMLFLAFIFVFKVFFYFFHKNQILPEKWYYKFLYICTLQIAPLFALWRALFY